MTTNEACLHNPGSAARTYSVTRPLVPAGSSVEVEGGARNEEMPLLVTVPPGRTAVVRVVAPGAPFEQRDGRRCSVMEPVAGDGPDSARMEMAR